MNMSVEVEKKTLQEEFEHVIKSENSVVVSSFLNDQNISDVAEIINQNQQRKLL